MIDDRNREQIKRRRSARFARSPILDTRVLSAIFKKSTVHRHMARRAGGRTVFRLVKQRHGSGSIRHFHRLSSLEPLQRPRSETRDAVAPAPENSKVTLAEHIRIGRCKCAASHTIQFGLRSWITAVIRRILSERGGRIECRKGSTTGYEVGSCYHCSMRGQTPWQERGLALLCSLDSLATPRALPPIYKPLALSVIPHREHFPRYDHFED